eukprot:8306053-Prorocentrum_lima.AAC.1
MKISCSPFATSCSSAIRTARHPSFGSMYPVLNRFDVAKGSFFLQRPPWVMPIPGVLLSLKGSPAS